YARVCVLCSLLLLFVSLKYDSYMAVSHFFTQSFAFLLNTARSFGLQGLGSRGQTRQCSIVWSVLRASSRHETRRGGHAEFRIFIVIIIYLLMIYKFIFI